MPITLNGSGTVSGISVGGLPDGCIQSADIASGVIPTGGKILQVKQVIKKDIFSVTTTGSSIGFVSGDVTGLSISITPSSATNKMLLMPSISISSDTRTLYIYKDGSLIDQVGDAANDGNGNALVRVMFGNETSSISNQQVTGMLLDTAGGTSAITYSIRIGALWSGSSTKTLYLNRTSDDNEVYNNYRLARYMSSFTILEVEA